MQKKKPDAGYRVLSLLVLAALIFGLILVAGHVAKQQRLSSAASRSGTR